MLILDSAWPLFSYPPGIDGLAFYIGGDTPHVWSTLEESICPYEYRLPIWVRSNPSSDLVSSDVVGTLVQLAKFGMPKGNLVALDSETSIDPSYVHDYVVGVNNGGYPVIDYGSVSTVFGNDNPDGYYWGADWTGVPHLHSNTEITQYVSFNMYDESLAQQNLPLWRRYPKEHNLFPFLIIHPARDEVPAGEAWPGDFLLCNGKIVHIVDTAMYNFLTTNGVPDIEITWSQYVAYGGM